MLKLAALGLSVAWKTGLIVAGAALVGGTMVEVGHVISDRRKAKTAATPAK